MIIQPINECVDKFLASFAGGWFEHFFDNGLILILCALGLFVVDQTPSLAQGACPGPSCRNPAAAAAKLADDKRTAQPATKAADEQKKAQQAAAKAAEAVKSNAPNMSTPGSKNMSQPSALDTVNNVKLGDQNSTPNRRPEVEDMKGVRGQRRKEMVEAQKKWDKEHPLPQEPTDLGTDLVRAVRDKIRSNAQQDYLEQCKVEKCAPAKNGGSGRRG